MEKTLDLHVKTNEMNWKKIVSDNYKKISGYNVLGLRATRPDEQYNMGDTARNSYDWDAENDTSSDNELNGASAILLDNSFLEGNDDLCKRIENTLPELTQYHGKQIILLGGWKESQGTDALEGVIESPRVLAIIY